MTEQLAFQKAFRNRGTVDSHKGTILARAGRMQRVGHHLLARTAFSFDVDIGFASGRLGHLGQHGLHHTAFGDDRTESRRRFHGWIDGRTVGCRSRRQTLFFQASFDLFNQLFAIERLGHVRAGAALHGIDGVTDGSVGGENDHRQVRVMLTQLLHQLHAVFAIEFVIDHGKVDIACLGQFQGLAPIGGGQDLIALGSQAQAHHPQDARVVVDGQQGDLCRTSSGFAHSLSSTHGRGIRCTGPSDGHSVAAIGIPFS